MLTNRVNWETLRSVDTGAMSWSAVNYNALGIPLKFPSYKLKLVNNSTVLVTVSIDGATDIDVAPANSFWLYDESQYGQQEHDAPAIPAGTQVYVKGAAGAGLIYLVNQYLIIR